jgi:hypothetical protein
MSIMENLYIEGSDTLPTVELRNDGLIKINGRALPENAFDFFRPMIIWVKEYSGEEINIEINLEYFNTAVSKQLHDFLRTIEENPHTKKISLKWFYEEGDDEILESGEIYEELLPKIKFSYHQFNEVYE